MPPETIRSRTEPRNLFSSSWWAPFHMESIRVSMKQITTFTVIDSPIGSITVVAKDGVICGLYNEGQKHWPEDSDSWRRDDGPVFDPVRKWLSEYFSGKKTRPLPKIAITTGTAFQKQVWNELLAIPVRRNSQLWRACRANRLAQSGARGGSCGRTEPDLHHGALPPGGRCRGKIDRIRRGTGKEEVAAETRTQANWRLQKYLILPLAIVCNFVQR